MGQAKNRGTREQRVIAAIARGTKDSEFTVTGRITSNVPNHEERSKEPRTEIKTLLNLDYSEIEARVLADGTLVPEAYSLAYGNPQKLGDVVRPPIRILHTGLRGRGTLALAALAASALAEIGRETVIVDIKEQDFTPEQRKTMEDWYKKEVNRGKQD